MKRALVALAMTLPAPAAFAADGLVVCANKRVKDTNRMYLIYATASELDAVRQDLPKSGIRVSENLDPKMFGLREVLEKWLPGRMVELVAFYDTDVKLRSEGFEYGTRGKRMGVESHVRFCEFALERPVCAPFNPC